VTIPKTGEQFRQFRILSKAGEGGMGVVFCAEDTRLGRSVALKFLTRFGPADTDSIKRIIQEARSLAALNHAGIVTIYDIGESEDGPFLVMEWIDGRPLNEFIEPDGCDEDTFLRIALPVAEALAAAHSCGIIHRDIKPANVLVTGDGRVKLLDFGIARTGDNRTKLTQTSAIIGTPAYMSPEQAGGGRAGFPSDIFSFGVLAYELLTGKLPFEGDSFPVIMYSILHTPHVPVATLRPDIPAPLAELVEKCLRKDPGDRFLNGSELAQELHRLGRMRNTQEIRQNVKPIKNTSIPPVDSPAIRYCQTTDRVPIAYAVHGSGPLLVRVLGWFSHLEMEWEWPALRLIWELLGKSHTVVRYDGRGMGLSGRWDGKFTEEVRQVDLDAVLNALGAEKAVLVGISEGGWIAAHYAAAHPQRISRLVVYGSYSRGIRFRPGYDAEENQALVTLMRKGWGRDTPEIRQIFTTAYFGSGADPGLVAHFNNLQRASTDGDTAARYQESLNLRGDAGQLLGTMKTPSLIIHCREDRIVPFEEGRLMASLIPGAKFLPFPTRTHYFPLDDELTYRMAEEIERFATQ
jgi:pimeloyl-ACP methyl ester carboxylesterase/predicted Ser/Thr protein kinase